MLNVVLKFTKVLPSTPHYSDSTRTGAKAPLKICDLPHKFALAGIKLVLGSHSAIFYVFLISVWHKSQIHGQINYG